jgi:hypothetical protein
MSYSLRIKRAGENRYPDTAEIMEPVPKSPAGIMSRTDDVRASHGPTEVQHHLKSTLPAQEENHQKGTVAPF